MYNIYWKKDIEIHFSNKKIQELWNMYLNSHNSRKIKCYVIYRLVNDDINNFNENYNNYIKNINLKTIPKIFYKNLKEYIYYQVNIEKNKIKNNKNKYIMRESIKTCPYCRESKI